MRVLKFGGSSVSTPERIQNVVNIVKDKFEEFPHLAVVVSAFGGVTDTLLHAAQKASQGHNDYFKALEDLKERHLKATEEIVRPENRVTIFDYLENSFSELKNLLHGIALVNELPLRTLDSILSFGERWSALIIGNAMKAVIPIASFVDARELVKTDRQFGSAGVLYDETYEHIQRYFSERPLMPVITGFIGSTHKGETTTLGRGGSDFTAALFGAALQAREIEIWTDVDGVMTADPRQVQQAFSIPQMTYKEALEMSHFGAKVIHPPTIAPALKKLIPIRIKNTFNPKNSGTLISQHAHSHTTSICGISSIDNIALLRVEGSGIVGVCGIAMRLFGALARNNINVILISQSSSEHSICFAVSPEASLSAKEAIEQEFRLELQTGFLDPIVVEGELAVIAAVGEQMRHLPGVAGRLFGALGKNGINVSAMAQGSSEYNISVVIKRADKAKALNALHEEFFLSRTTTLNVFVLGTGLIGSTLLDQMARQIAPLQREHALEIRLVGLANSRNVCFDASGLEIGNWRALLTDNSSAGVDIESYLKQMQALNLSNSIFVDCTASDLVASYYPSVLEASISIVTPNKQANAGPYAFYNKLKETSRRREVSYLYETTVGAGLPCISTVSDLRKSGDRIIMIEAILSGTLSYIFNTLSVENTFSKVLQDAKQAGYTEPDPREDLTGRDVLRKLLILARESGYPLEEEDIILEPLLPDECLMADTVEEFYKQLALCDNLFEDQRRHAANAGKVLRYIATLEEGIASIGLRAVNEQHPFFHLSGSDNIVALTTERYAKSPLVIKGQGAGAAVTAGGVFADILRIGMQ